tara:strand:- start:45 stop:491 length:447 start_codon:yes stop_codon:yes gene_type:complete
MLKAFISTGETCRWPECYKEAVKTTLPINGKTIHCIKHQLRKYSGRVDHNNWKRDYYREYLKPQCELSGVTWRDQYKETVLVSKKLGKDLSRHELVRRTCQAFEVDHKDGNHKNNEFNNLQTLTKSTHKLKTDLNGDSNPMKNKKAIK